MQSLLGYLKKSANFDNSKGLKADDRPILINYKNSSNLLFENIKLSNSPFFHLNFDDCSDVVITNLIVHVDTVRQKTLHHKFGQGFLEHIPIFPLNTDGIGTFD